MDDDLTRFRKDDVPASRISADRVAEIVLKLVATQQELAQARERVTLEVGVSDLLARQLTEAEAEIGSLSEKVTSLVDRSDRAEAVVRRLRVLLARALDEFDNGLPSEVARDRIRRDAGLL